MFERFTEPARRSLFFARYEAGVLSRHTIETEHLLLGIVKEREPLLVHLLSTAELTADDIKRLIYARTGVPRSHLDVSVEIPFSADAKQVLTSTAEEASRLLHRHVGTEHLLLGLLRVERGLAWDVLRDAGLSLTPIREALVAHVSATSPPPPEIAGILAALLPHGAERVRPRSAGIYSVKVVDGPSPGRRATTDEGGSVGLVDFSTVDFSTHTQEQGLHSIGPISMSATTLPQFALVLEEFLGSPVMLLEQRMPNQLYDIELKGTYDNAEALIAAVRDQLGLELTRSL